jgi:hypothetical protein
MMTISTRYRDGFWRVSMSACDNNDCELRLPLFQRYRGVGTCTMYVHALPRHCFCTAALAIVQSCSQQVTSCLLRHIIVLQ